MPYRDKEKERAYKREWARNHPECGKDTLRKWRETHREHIRKYMREYQKRPEVKERRRRWKQEHPTPSDIAKARHLAQEVPLRDRCEICGSTENLERHHYDYSKPQEVITVCHSCNMHLPHLPVTA